MKYTILLIVSLLLAGCGGGSSPPQVIALPPPLVLPPPTPTISMAAANWVFLGRGMPAHPDASGAGWAFAFPLYAHVPTTDCNLANCPEISYIFTPTTVQLADKTLTMDFQLDVSGDPTLQYALNTDNTCVAPASVKFLIQQAGDPETGQGVYEFYRWFSTDVYTLTPGAGSLSVPTTAAREKWVSVFGKRGNDPAAASGFDTAVNNLGNVGMAFGGGCFAGHGVNINQGSATFTLKNLSAQ